MSAHHERYDAKFVGVTIILYEVKLRCNSRGFSNEYIPVKRMYSFFFTNICIDKYEIALLLSVILNCTYEKVDDN